MTHVKKIFWKLLYIREIAKTALQRFVYRGAIDQDRVRSILVVRLYGIGNMVLATPALRALRRGYPDSRITVLASGNDAWDVISGSRVVDSVIFFGRDQTIDPALLARLRSARFDLMVVFYPMGVVDLPLLAALSGIRYRFGYRNAVRGNLYTHRFDMDYKKGEGRLNLDLACRAGGRRGGGPFFSIGTADRERIDRLFSDGRIGDDEIVITFHPGSQEMRRWPKDCFAALGDKLVDSHHARIILLGGPDERRLCRDISKQMKSKPIIAAGLLTLKETAEVIGRSDLFVGNDSGPMHIATAVSTPCVGLFGPTDNVKSRPWGRRGKTATIRSRMECAPCYKNGEIPCIYDTNLCMAGISVQDVYSRSLSLLAGETVPRRNRERTP
ncbi:MAG: glycosyltransferase family 9 protein [Deltaproteobacteria bacterium]|nr:glycosyltransferase family 9 protein [Candidatus Zymogenaceae bacterium]